MLINFTLGELYLEGIMRTQKGHSQLCNKHKKRKLKIWQFAMQELALSLTNIIQEKVKFNARQYGPDALV